MSVMKRPHRYRDNTVRFALCAPKIHCHQRPSVVAILNNRMSVPPQAGLLLLAGKKRVADDHLGAGVVV